MKGNKSGKGVFGQYKGYQLMESQIRYAMSNTTSNAEAAKWLHVSFSTWKKYAKRYIDSETGKTLFQLHKETGFAQRLVLPKTKYRRKASSPWAFQPLPMADIFANKHLRYCISRFKDRLVKEGWKEERCEICGYQDRRVSDYEVPLRINWLDDNKRNYSLENIQLICHNCYFIHVGNLNGGKSKQFKIDEVTGEVVPAVPDRKTIRDQTVPLGPYFKPRTYGQPLPESLVKNLKSDPNQDH